MSDSNHLFLDFRGHEYESIGKSRKESSAYLEIFGNIQQAGK